MGIRRRRSRSKLSRLPALVMPGSAGPGLGMEVGCGKAVIGNARHIRVRSGLRTGMPFTMEGMCSFGAGGDNHQLQGGSRLNFPDYQSCSGSRPPPRGGTANTKVRCQPFIGPDPLIANCTNDRDSRLRLARNPPMNLRKGGLFAWHAVR